MIRMFCDKCKEEIKHNDRYFKIKADETKFTNDKILSDGPYVDFCAVLCNKCNKEIFYS